MKPATQKIIRQTILLLIVFCGFSSQKILAQTSTGLSAMPPRLEVTVKPDGSSTQTIKVRNESNEERVITTEVRDFVVTDNKGTPTVVDVQDESSNRWAASSWIQVSPSSLKLKPGETKSLILTILPPTNALPGGHYAMVIYRPEKSGSINSTGAAIQANVGTLVYVTVPGDIKQSAIVQKFSAPRFSEFGPINFSATIKNSSDIHIQPVGSINVKSWLGRKTQIALEPTNIFPYTTREFKSVLNKKWLFGRYQADLQAVYGTEGDLVTATIFFWVIPWRLLVLITAAVAIVITLIVIAKKNPKSKKPSTTDEVAELEKELEALKKKYKDQ